MKILEWLGLIRIDDHDRQIKEILRADAGARMRRQQQAGELEERNARTVQIETGARIAAENESARLRGVIVAINHANGKPAGWTPDP